MLKTLFGKNTKGDERVEDLRKLNELLQKQPKNHFEKPITWSEPKPADKP